MARYGAQFGPDLTFLGVEPCSPTAETPGPVGDGLSRTGDRSAGR